MNENIKLEFVINNLLKLDNIIKKKTKIGAVLKDQYQLLSNMNISYFAYLLDKNTNLIDVFLFNNLSNAMISRKLGIKKKIVLLYYITPEEVQIALDNDIEITCPSIEWLNKTLSIIKFKDNKLKLHVYYDSNIGREGFINENELYDLLIDIKKNKMLELTGLGSKFNQKTDELNVMHLKHVTSETRNKIMKDFISTQVDKFDSIIKYCKDNNLLQENTKIHAGCSKEVYAEYTETYYDFVRIGNLLFKPTFNPFKIKTQIIHIKKVPKDYCIGYFCKNKTKKEITIAYIKKYNITNAIYTYNDIVLNPIFNLNLDPYLIDIDKIKDIIKIGDYIDITSTIL
jgi:alanine racemase